MENKKKRSANAPDKQKKMLVEYVKNKPQLISGKQTQSYTMKDAMKDWENIANILNSSPGANKDWRGWRKTWHDLRSRTKSKEAKNRMECRGTGNLNAIEDEIELDLTNSEITQGHHGQEMILLSVEDPANMGILTQSTHTTASTLEDSSHTVTSVANPPAITSSAGLKIGVPITVAATTVHGVPNISPKITTKKLPKKLDSLINSAVAATRFDENLSKKLDIKNKYYNNKMIHMKNIEELKLKKIKALESIAKCLRVLVKKKTVS